MKRLIYLFCFFCFVSANIIEGRVNFIHIPKTGGTTVHSVLSNNYNEKAFYPFRIPNEQCPMIDHGVVSGHFSFQFFKEKDPDFDRSFFFTILRDPVDRVISEFFFLKEKGRKIDSPLSIHRNVMCHMLCSDPSLSGGDLVNDCIKTLERMNFILFQDNLDSDIKILFKKLGFKKTVKRIPFNNMSKHEPINSDMLEKIAEANDLDVQLYEYARTHFRTNS